MNQKKINTTYQEYCKSLSEEEIAAFDLFLNLRCAPFEEKAKIKALENHWGKQYPAAKIFRSKNMSGIQTGNCFPGREKYLGYLETGEGRQDTESILRTSKTYSRLDEARNGGQLSTDLINAFLSIKNMMLEDLADGKEITSLSRYVKRNGLSPFEREKLQASKASAVKNQSFDLHFKQIISENIDQFESDIRTMLSSSDFIRSLKYSEYYSNCPDYSEYPPRFTKTELRKELEEIRDDLFDMHFLVPLSKGDYKFKTNRWFRDKLDERIDGLVNYSHKRDEFGERVLKECSAASEALFAELKKRFPREVIRNLIHRNPAYMKDLAKYKRLLERKEKEQSDLLDRIPEFYRDSFPEARRINRKFILHIGPTNSGKTHDAVEALKTADNGIYLAPLRLLAFEQFETLNDAGVKCSMVTGEEQILLDGSTVQSSTVEMLPEWKQFDVAVIDEAQMIRDPDRGGAWCTAMYGIKATEIHVCAAPEAEEILKQIINDCGDTYKTVYHKRMSKLEYKGNRFKFPDDVQNGDALICFSRKNVHAVASELSDAGISTSIIYGSLPYDVRHTEAKRFADGNAKVLVATDAIGMGMNLPIKRVVFLETSKFDGNEVRNLTASEVKQIAGRAGRFGIYPVGEVVSWGTQIIKNGLNKSVLPIKKVIIDFPEQLISAPGKLSKIMGIWERLPNEEMFEKADISIMKELTRWCEKYSSDKELIMQFAKMPFDTDNRILRSTWEELFLNCSENRESDINEYLKYQFTSGKTEMENLEFQYSYLDLLYNYCRRFQADYCVEIINAKQLISEKIMNLLKKRKFRKRVCKYCGTRLPWHYSYTMCQECYKRQHKSYWFEDEYWED